MNSQHSIAGERHTGGRQSDPRWSDRRCADRRQTGPEWTTDRAWIHRKAAYKCDETDASWNDALSEMGGGTRSFDACSV